MTGNGEGKELSLKPGPDPIAAPPGMHRTPFRDGRMVYVVDRLELFARSHASRPRLDIGGLVMTAAAAPRASAARGPIAGNAMGSMR